MAKALGPPAVNMSTVTLKTK